MPTPDPGAVPDGAGPGDLAGLRVLAISSLYPPHHLGGYEAVHRSVDEELTRRGAAVRVLVSDHREEDALVRHLPDPPDVHRELRSYWQDHAFPRMGPFRVLAQERHNHRTLLRHLEEHRPDVVAFWAMGGMSLSLIGAVRTAGIPAVHVVHDRWPVYGPQFDRFARGIRPLGPLRGPLARRLGTDRPRRPQGTVLVNATDLAEELARTRAIPASWRVIPPGVEVPAEPAPLAPWRGRLLSLGRLDPRSGPDVAVDALVGLGPSFRLTLAGGGDPAVARALRERADQAGVGPRLTLTGRTEPEDLPALLAAHDALLVPVRRPEPFGRAPLQAMAHGLPVVATALGGQGSYLRDGENALVVPVDDPDAVAAAVRRLHGEPGLRERLRAGGRTTAEDHDELRARTRMADAIAQAAGAGMAADEGASWDAGVASDPSAPDGGPGGPAA
jgi:glycosyltransferase involved in cell wall biosynthesis